MAAILESGFSTSKLLAIQPFGTNLIWNNVSCGIYKDSFWGKSNCEDVDYIAVWFMYILKLPALLQLMSSLYNSISFKQGNRIAILVFRYDKFKMYDIINTHTHTHTHMKGYRCYGYYCAYLHHDLLPVDDNVVFTV